MNNWLLNNILPAPRFPNSEVLSKLTVIIPSYERQRFLIRQVAFWANCPAQILILDGSKNSIDKETLQIISQQKNISYHHLPISVEDRINFAGEKITTAYAVMLGDDEFHLKSGLIAAVEKLEKNPELTAIIGQSLRFYVAENNQFCTYDEGYKHQDFHVVSNDIQERLQQALQDYNAASSYAVFRADGWKISWGNTKRWSSPYVAEMYQAAATYILGKLSSTEKVYWMRSNENPPVTLKNFNRDNSFVNWWSDPKYSDEKQRFIFLLSELILQRNPNQVDAEAKEVIINSFDQYSKIQTDKFLQQNDGVSLVSRLKRFVIKMLKFAIPENFYFQIKKLLKPRSTSASAAELGKLGKLDQLKMDEQLKLELTEVESLLISFYKGFTK